MRKDTKAQELLGRYGADTSGLNPDTMLDLIRERAYQLFEMRGRESGHELEDWLQAEREIRTRFQT
jgi:Protein of unknown function (DUF2934)